jgi:hypothetical protein
MKTLSADQNTVTMRSARDVGRGQDDDDRPCRCVRRRPGPGPRFERRGHPDEPMTQPTATSVSVLQRGEHRAGAAAIAAGHVDYPTFRHLYPDPHRRARALGAFFTATVRDGIPFGSVLGIRRGPLVAATAVWLPPGAFPWSARRKMAGTPAFLRVRRRRPRDGGSTCDASEPWSATATAKRPSTP